MKPIKHFSLASAACLLLATSLPTGCSSSLPIATQSEGAAVTGIVYTGRSTDGRLVPPPDPVTVQIMEKDKEIATGQTDNLGRFYLKNIPAPKEGKVYTVRIANVFEQNEKLFAGRVLNLASIQAQEDSGNQTQLKTVSGTLLNAADEPLANVEIRDKDFTFRKTKTNASGAFTLEVASKTVEVLFDAAQPPVPIEITEFAEQPIVKIDTNSVRSINGTVKDLTNSNVFLENVKIKVRGSSVSARTDKNGKFVLNGAPIGPFILEAEAFTGYATYSEQIPPAEFDTNNRPKSFTQDIFMNPVGSVLVSFHAEDAPYLPSADGTAFTRPASLDPEDIYPTWCLPINCKVFDIQPADGTQETYYNNTLGTQFPLKAIVSIEGTNLSQEIDYPASELLTLRGSNGIEKIEIEEAVRSINRIMSVKFDNVPGGRQTVTVSLTGYQTQKSIPVFVPPNDTISTELITLYNVHQVSGIGDVKGIIRGVDPNLNGALRIGYVDLSEGVDIAPYVIVDGELPGRTDPDLLEKIENAVTSPRSVTINKTTGEYYLKNVPTGTRILLAASMVDDDGQLSDCYIPSTVVLLNVRAGEINLAPDMTMIKRPDCGS